MSAAGDENPFEAFRFAGSSKGDPVYQKRPRSRSTEASNSSQSKSSKPVTARRTSCSGSKEEEGCEKLIVSRVVHDRSVQACAQVQACALVLAASKSNPSSRAKAQQAEDQKKRKITVKAQLSQPPAIPNFQGWLPIYETMGGGGQGEILPVVVGAGTPRGWRERWCAVCDDCFERGYQCTHFPELALRLLIIGHNPSVKTWTGRLLPL
jgi:hypothetical protein